MPKPKEIAKRGASSGTDKLKQQVREVSGRNDSAESYGGDRIEEGSEYVAVKAKDIAEDIGGKVKNKIESKIKDRATERVRDGRERPNESEPSTQAESSHYSDEPHQPQTRKSDAVKTRERRADEPIRSPREVERAPQQQDAKIEIKGRDTETITDAKEPVRERDVRTRSDSHSAESIKTKENYLSRNKEYSGQQTENISGYAPKEKPQMRQEAKIDNGSNVKTNDNTAVDNKAMSKLETPSRTYQGGKEYAQRQSQYRKSSIRTSQNQAAQQTSSNAAQQSAKGTIKTTEKGAVKTASKGTVKTAQTTVKATGKTVKTAERTAKTTTKAAKATAKTAQKAAQAAAKATKAAAQAAAKAAKLAAKAVVSAVKAIIAAIKGLIAAIAAGGWVAVVIILAIAIVALILCACFGVFASNETEDGSKPMTDAIIEIDTSFKAGIDERIAELSTGDYEEVVVEYVGDMDGDSEYLINWNDVIAVYSVMVTMDEDAPTDVIEVTPEKIEKLKEIFYDMNSVSYTTDVEETEEIIENEDGEEETIIHRKLIIHVDVKSLDYLAAADLYQFNETKREALEAMMEPRMLALYAELIGIDVYGGEDLTKIISGLPVGTMGSDVLKVALTKVGNPYVLGAKGPNRFDCSGLVYWSIHEIDPELGRNLYTSAGYQYKYCRDNGYLVGESEVQPGDIIFWYKPNCNCGKKYNEVHHTGFYLGDGMILDASSSNGRVIIRKLFDGSSYKVYAYARPYSY